MTERAPVGSFVLLAITLLAAMPAFAERMYSNDALASALIGKGVVNLRGERLGEISDIVVDLERGVARVVLLETGGFAGLFETVRALPFAWLARGRHEDRVLLDVSRAELDGAGRAPPPGLRATALIGEKVYDPAGREAGELRDLVVNLGDGKLRYALIALEQPARQVTIEPQMLTASAHALVVNMASEDLRALGVR